MIVMSYGKREAPPAPDPGPEPAPVPGPGPVTPPERRGVPGPGPITPPKPGLAPEPAPGPAAAPGPEPAPGPGTPAAGGTETDRVAARLRAALGPLLRRLRQVRPDGELTLSQTSVLVRLDRDGPATASELAAAEGIRPQSMSPLVTALLARGLIGREPDPGDRRRMVLSPTSAGHGALSGARAERARRLAAAIDAELTPAERDLLAAAIPLLERITRRV
jgi:DNA-binding MarR family transcriptional regulator